MLRRSIAAGFAAVAIFSSGSGCRRGSSSAPTTGDVRLPDGGVLRRSDVLESLGRCVLATATEFDTNAAALERATAAHEQAPSEVTRAAARAAWVQAMDAWEKMEVMQVGPAAAKGTPGGRALRDEIYAWPLLNRCQVDVGVVEQAWSKPEFAGSLVTSRTLFSLEYLLFNEGLDNGCAAEANINASGSWKALSADALASRRASYGHGIAADVLTRAHALVEAWDPARGNFVAQLRDAGTGVYSSQQMAFNAINDALFYLEFSVKDLKLAVPSGISGCLTPTCPAALESPWAARSKEHVRKNLEAFRALYRGCGGLGFDDLLRALGQGAVADHIESSTKDALAAVDRIDESDLAPALIADPESVRAVHAEIKRVTDILKTEFVTILDLELPKKAEGDND